MNRAALAAALVAPPAAALAAVAALRRRWTVVSVVGGSMLPAMREGDVVLARRRRPHGARVGDVVVLEPPGPDGRWRAPPARGPRARRTWMIKRVAVLPGDPVPPGVPETGVVAAGSLVVLGDNGGLDSTVFGALPDERVLAVVVRSLGRGPSSGREYVIRDGAHSGPMRTENGG